MGCWPRAGGLPWWGLSRWTEKGGIYQTIQRFYTSELPWKAIHWLSVRLKFLKPIGQYFIAGDEVVVSKAGKDTYGLDRFFSSIQQRVIPGLAFFIFSLVNVVAGRSYPLQMTQMVRSTEEKAASKARKEAKKATATTSEKRKRGRPKGSKNKSRQAVVLNAELARTQTALKSQLETIGNYLSLVYVVMEGHFGNYQALTWFAKRACT